MTATFDFAAQYNRKNFVNFLRNSFLGDNFAEGEASIDLDDMKFNLITEATSLGERDDLDLEVYEVKHNTSNYNRVTLSREAFKIMLHKSMHNYALIAFLPKGEKQYRFSLLHINAEKDSKSTRIHREYSNPRRYSYVLGEGIGTYTPNQYLAQKGAVTGHDDLRERFSVEILTKAFYSELSHWFFWAKKIVHFPNDIKDPNDNDKFNSEALIRMVTRLIFVWFLKQKKLIPDEFFDDKRYIPETLNGFNPDKVDNLFGKSKASQYYKAILQNLFFAMLNSPITPEGKMTISERRFRKGRDDFDNNKLMRYEKFFNKNKAQEFLDLANQCVPFLNGGLFDCLDEKNRGMYYDAFTDREAIQKQLIVPDYLFFGKTAGKDTDLSDDYGAKTIVNIEGIIDILKRYNFTVEENMPYDQEVSLDPELLGNVFENLLASYNPETQTTARKQTGSYYTPKEIVQFMVDESLTAYLKRKVGEKYELVFSHLLQYKELTDKEQKEVEEIKDDVIQALYECKILDPACGSGAFPMGVLQQMVHLLNQLDPDNKQWKALLTKQTKKDAADAIDEESKEERDEAIDDVKKSFDTALNHQDYARKLYLIENCIYGVDVQSIAIQISKLRFFISLVVDQKPKYDKPEENFGIRPLPNLEAKFVAADSLIALQKNTERSLFDNDEIIKLQDQQKKSIHWIFAAKTYKTKKKHQDKVQELGKEIARLLKESEYVGNEQAYQLGKWNRFDQNAVAPFFDPEWMFGVSDGFDIVLGNPPYISTKGVTTEMKKKLEEEYGFADDTYNHFFFKGIDLLKSGGVLSLITPKTFWTTQTKLNLRNKLLGLKINSIFDTANPFATVMVDTCITSVINEKPDKKHTIRFLDGSQDLKEPTAYPVKQDVYLNTQNSVIFKPTKENMRIWELYGEKVKDLYNKWWDKIKTSRDIEKNKKELEEYRNSLKPGDVALLGCLTEGGQGLATANNGKYIAVRSSTKWADNIRQSRPKKLAEVIDKFKIHIPGLNKFDSIADYLDSLSEAKIAQLFDRLKEEYGRDIFGQGYIFRIIDDSELADVDSLSQSEKENGISSSKKYYVPYDKGDKDGNRWYLETPFAIAWTKENVRFLKTDPRARYQGYAYYFREGFCWTNVLNPCARLLKVKLKQASVNDVGSMSLFPLLLSNNYFVTVLNSNLLFDYYREFVNCTVNIQINDIRLLPIVIPSKKQISKIDDIFRKAYNIQTSVFSNVITTDVAKTQLSLLQHDVDNCINELYGI